MTLKNIISSNLDTNSIFCFQIACFGKVNCFVKPRINRIDIKVRLLSKLNTQQHSKRGFSNDLTYVGVCICLEINSYISRQNASKYHPHYMNLLPTKKFGWTTDNGNQTESLKTYMILLLLVRQVQ